MSTPQKQADSSDVSIPDDQPAAFEATVDSAVLRTWLETVTAVHSEGIVSVSTGGLECNMIGPANVSGVDSTFENKGFKSFTVQRGGEIGVDFDKLDSVLTTMSQSDTVDLSINDRHCLVIDGDSAHYEMGLIDLKNLDDKEHDVGFDRRNSVSIAIKPTRLLDGLNLVSIADETCKFAFELETETFSITTKSDTDEGGKTFDDGSYEQATLSPKSDGDVSMDTVASLYRVEYAKKQLSPTDGSKPISVLLSTDYPMVWNYSLEDCISVSALIAPRLPTDNDRLRT